MDFKSGNFDFPGNLIPAEDLEQQPGRFGYIIWWPHLRMNSSGKLFVEADAEIHRHRKDSIPPAILVRAVKGGGLEIEVVGSDVLDPRVPSDKKPSKTAIPVKRIKAGGKTYPKWDDEIRYFSIRTMPIGPNHTWFIERERVSTFADSRGDHRTRHFSGVKKKGGKTRIPIRRLSKDEYQVQMPRRGWVSLKIDFD